MKKIILIIGSDDTAGGVASYINSIVSNSSDEYIFHATISEETGFLSKKIIKHKMPKTYNILSLIVQVIQLRNLIKKIKPHLIHLNTARSGLLGVLSTTFSKIPIIYSGHSWRFEQEKNLFKYFYFKNIEKFISKNSSCVTFLTLHDLNTGKKLNLINPEKSIAINTRIDINKKNQEPANQVSIINKYKISINSNIIINIGSLTERKNPKLFVEIANLLIKETNSHFIWIGSGDQQDEINRLIKNYKMEDKFTLTGTISNEEVLEIIRVADCVLFTSKYEGVPLSLIEAKLSRIPIVSSNYPSVDEIIRNNIDGYVFDMNSPQEACCLIKIILNDKKIAENFIQNGYIFALERHTNAKKMSDEFIALYEKMIV